MMKVLVLSDPASIHTVKWVNALSSQGFNIHLFGLGDKNPRISNHVVQHIFKVYPSRKNVFQKLKYLTAVPYLKKIYRDVRPNIVHAHFATSYGLLGSFLRHRPYIVSLWGSDIFDFPKRSCFHKRIVKQILDTADRILSTSASMKSEGLKYTNEDVYITPFGVDLKVFHPGDRQIKMMGREKVFELGVVKALEKKYGVDILIKAYAAVIQKVAVKTKLTIVGGGSQLEELGKLIEDLSIQSHVEFTGAVPHSEVIYYHRLFDLEIFPSILDSESFGVSVVEAMACGTPVIVSDVSGFKEVVSNGECGMVVRRNSVPALTDAILQMIEKEDVREEYVRRGLKKVRTEYDWDQNVQLMVSHYHRLINPKA